MANPRLQDSGNSRADQHGDVCTWGLEAERGLDLIRRGIEQIGYGSTSTDTGGDGGVPNAVPKQYP